MEVQLSLNGIGRLVVAGTPLICIETVNEQRTEQLLHRTAETMVKGLPTPKSWSRTQEFETGSERLTPQEAVQWAGEQEGAGLFIFKDIDAFWHEDVGLRRALLDIAQQRHVPGKSLVFLTGKADIPIELQAEFVVLQHGLPDRAEIQAWFEKRVEGDPVLAAVLRGKEDLDTLVLAAQGLDTPAVERALRLVRVSRNPNLTSLIRELYDSKKQVLRRTGIMEFVENEDSPESVGGMAGLKQWMAKREAAFSKEDMTQGRNLPRGVLIMGVSGCGKSLLVKAIAGGWNLPLVRLDMASVYDGVHGSPESSLRLATRTAEALAPCVLWIDEIEAGISSQGFKAEGGAASRVLGYFLTWMQEKAAPVFVAATANAIEMLPAELLRKGRFDEVFYVDLPDLTSRTEIFKIHLRKRGYDLDEFKTDMLAHSAKGFSGAEIEQAVAGAVLESQSDRRPMCQQDIMNVIGRTVPLSSTMAEQIKSIEAWAFKRAVPAAGSN